MPEVQTRIRFKNILFATDFSKAAASALPYATKLASAYGSKIWALHVNPLVINPMTDPNTWKPLEEAAEIRKKKQTEKLRDALRGKSPEIIIAEGDLRSVLDSTMQENNIDLVVMGTRGRSGIPKIVLGSVAEEVFRNVSCPVLTVGPKVSAAAAEPGTFSKIVLATGLDPKKRAAVPFALSLAQEFAADLTLLHVIEDPKTSELVQWPELEDSSIRLLRAMVPADAQQWCVPDFVVKHGDPAAQILAVAARKRADLIVLGLHESQGVPGAATHLPISVAHKVVAQASCPVLTVRD